MYACVSPPACLHGSTFAVFRCETWQPLCRGLAVGGLARWPAKLHSVCYSMGEWMMHGVRPAEGRTGQPGQLQGIFQVRGAPGVRRVHKRLEQTAHKLQTHIQNTPREASSMSHPVIALPLAVGSWKRSHWRCPNDRPKSPINDRPSPSRWDYRSRCSRCPTTACSRSGSRCGRRWAFCIAWCSTGKAFCIAYALSLHRSQRKPCWSCCRDGAKGRGKGLAGLLAVVGIPNPSQAFKAQVCG